MVDFSTTPINSFFEIDATGEIVKGFGFGNGFIRFIHEDGTENRIARVSAEQCWTARPDLQWWPNSDEQLLPHVFDLFFDLKTVSQLRDAVQNAFVSRDLDMVNDLCRFADEHNIDPWG